MANKRIHELGSATLDGDFSIPVDKSTLAEVQQVTVDELIAFMQSGKIDYASSSTYTWPLAADYTGLNFTLKSTYSGTCAVSMQGSETIDGLTSFDLIEYECVTAVSDGTNWLVI